MDGACPMRAAKGRRSNRRWFPSYTSKFKELHWQHSGEDFGPSLATKRPYARRIIPSAAETVVPHYADSHFHWYNYRGQVTLAILVCEIGDRKGYLLNGTRNLRHMLDSRRQKWRSLNPKLLAPLHEQP